MKTDTQIMNELAVQSGFLKPLSENDRNSLKVLLLEMYRDISNLCKTEGLVYMLSGGSCLGAVRHEGFIPWDDDLDLMMPRRSYNRLIELCKSGALGAKYEFDAPNKDNDCKTLFLKIYRKHTADIELHDEFTPGPKGVFIDIFPIESAPKSRLLRILKGVVSDVIAAISVSVLYAQYPSRRYEEFMSLNNSANRRYKLRLLIGKIFGIVKHKQWVWWFERLNSSTDDTGYSTIPTGRGHYLGEILPTFVFVPVSRGVFEGEQANLPAEPDVYLKARYGNYMAIPPVEKRERHFVFKFNCEINQDQ